MTLLMPSLPKLIKDRATRVLEYAYAMEALEKLAGSIQTGDSRLHVDLVIDPRKRAEQALIELAIYLRAFDDELAYQYQRNVPTSWSSFEVGRLQLLDGREVPLTPRELANKVIHAEIRSWATWGSLGPMVVCHLPIDETRLRRPMDNWIAAEIELHQLGQLLFQIGG